MKNQIYLLSLEELLETDQGEKAAKCLYEQAVCKIDTQRAQKLERLKGKARMQSLGAGLLLQLAVQKSLQMTAPSEAAQKSLQMAAPLDAARKLTLELPYEQYSVFELSEMLEAPIPLAYQYSARGKPYLDRRKFPFAEQLPAFYFSLSHSEALVVCAVSETEIGADIQLCKPMDEKKLCTRFFHPSEQARLAQCENAEERLSLFYRLWTCKEAYAKYTGEGIGASLGQETAAQRGVCFRQAQLKAAGGHYCLAVCEGTGIIR